ncbi:MAG: glutamine amidotransferase [Gammaproteobacteria bacterium]|nr:glutamine amidotransferase [Gammaproteobacteria bacterium]
MVRIKTAVAIRHLPFEDLGTFEEPLTWHGYTIRYLNAGVDNIKLNGIAGADLLIVLGGPIGAGDDKDYPFLLDEMRVIESRLKNNLPVLGICLGSQIMARVLGANVYPADEKEIGWFPIELTEEGRRSSLKYLEPEAGPVFHWHGDTFDLPADAKHLAFSSACKHQAFSYGENALGLQFHPEVSAHRLEQWYIGHTREIQRNNGLSVEGMRADSKQHSARMVSRAYRFCDEWLKKIETV